MFSGLADENQEELALLPVCFESITFVLITVRNAKRGKWVSRTMDCFHDRIAGCLVAANRPCSVSPINLLLSARGIKG